MASYNPVVKNASGGAVLYTALFPRTPTGQTQDNPTLASGDVKISIDGGAYTNLGTLPSVSPAGSDNVKITLSQAETNGDNLTIRFRDQSGAEWCDQHIVLQTVAANFDALNTKIDTIDSNVDDILVDTAEIGTAGAGLTEAGGTGDHLTALATASALSTVDSNVDAILVDTGTTLPGTLATIEGKIDTVDLVADAIKAKTDNLPSDPADASIIAGRFDTVDSALTTIDGNVDAVLVDTGTTIPGLLATIDGVVDDILADTGTTGVVVASASKSGYSLAADQSSVTVGTVNALGTQAKADVNAEADTALVDYDPPTRTEATSDKNEVLSAISGVDGKIDTVDGVVDAILVDTAVIGAAGAGLTAIPWNASWDAEVQSECADALAAYDPPTKAELDTAVSGLATSTELGDVSAVTDKLDTMIEDSTGYRFTEKALEEAPSAGSAPTVGEIADAVWDEAISGHQSAGTAGEALYVGATRDIPWNSDWDAEVQSEVTDALDAYDPPTRSEATADKAEILTAMGDVPTANENADALLDRSNGVETGLTLRGAQRLMAAALAGKASGLATTTATFRNAVADSKTRITATVDEDGNRSAVSTDTT